MSASRSPRGARVSKDGPIAHSILPTDKLGILRSTSGGLVVLLLDAVLVAEVVPFVEPVVPEAAEDDTDVTAGVDEVEAADCAAVKVNREPKESNRKP